MLDGEFQTMRAFIRKYIYKAKQKQKKKNHLTIIQHY
jgi:hypothetical protein